MEFQAVIFDLDGVITDTAEYHYRAWKRMADEVGLPFDREVNERLRGVSRRASLEIILGDREVSEEQKLEMMERKNNYYISMLEEVTPQDLLPGALKLINELRSAEVKVAIGSASKNARTVIDALGIANLLDAVADGYSVQHTKPAPDLFLRASELLGVHPAACVVVEDAAAGVDAALAAGMWAVGLGPEERVGHADARFDDLDGVTLAGMREALEAAAWTLAETSFSIAEQHHRETIYTIGNGYMSIRGTFEEGYPGDLPACFIHRLWDDMPVHFSELANTPRWLGIDVWVNGERFRLDRGVVESYRRELDLRTGVLSRTVRWRPSEASDAPLLEFRFERLVSLAEQHLSIVLTRVTLVAGEATVRLRTGLDAHVENTGLLHWQMVGQGISADEVWLQTRTRGTGIDLAVAASLTVSSNASPDITTCETDGQPVVDRDLQLRAGQTFSLEKYVGLVSTNEAVEPLEAAQHVARTAKAKGYQAALKANARQWAETWKSSDVIVEGDHEAQSALRFNIFQMLIAAPRFTDRASIGAKALSGFGYRHHVFWDTEIFMLPLFTYTQPMLARNMLMYRWHGLPGAREKAQANGYEGAQFPWESAATGKEVTPAWITFPSKPHELVRIWTGEIEIHITADVAYAVVQYWRAAGDDEWMRDYGAEIILDGAKFWASAAQLGEDGQYHYLGVIGPDEYHEHVDDNGYTNWMARWHLRTALEVLTWLGEKYPERRAGLEQALDLSESRLSQWNSVIERMCLPMDPETGLIEQFSGYLGLKDADVDRLRDPERTRPIQALLGFEPTNQTQYVKQPDVLMLQYLLPTEFTPEQVRVNYEYYSPRTDHEQGSSLGPAISAVMALRAGDDKTAYDLFMRAARADLLDVRHNAGDGIHAASAGGLWQTVVFGFAGLRFTNGDWEIRPRLPQSWTRLAFQCYYRGKLEVVDIRSEDVERAAVAARSERASPGA